MKNILIKKFIIASILSGVIFSILFSIFIFLFLTIIGETNNTSLISLLGFNLYSYIFLGLIFGMLAYFYRNALINKKISKYILLVFASLFFGYAISFLFMFSGLIYLSPMFFMLMAHIAFIEPLIDFFSINNFTLFFLDSIAVFFFVLIFESIVFTYLFNYFVNKRNFAKSLTLNGEVR